MKVTIDLVTIERRITVDLMKERGKDITVEEVLREAGIEFDPQSQKIVNQDDGQFDLDGVIFDGDRVLILPNEPDQIEGDGAV